MACFLQICNKTEFYYYKLLFIFCYSGEVWTVHAHQGTEKNDQAAWCSVLQWWQHCFLWVCSTLNNRGGCSPCRGLNFPSSWLLASCLPRTLGCQGGSSAGGNNSPACRWPRSSCACCVFIALCRASPPHPILSSRHVYESTSCLPLGDLKWLLLLENLHFCLLEVITNLEILQNLVF